MGALDLFPLPADSEYGYAEHSTFQRGVHEGLDIFAPLGTPVLAVFDGTARGVLEEGKGGNVVYLEAPGPFGRRAFYAHLDSLEPPLAIETVEV
ncbi:MAG TPA: M23 family metallopeptidase, partial [Polyangiaceae bacterium]|nr:M23 family metallopeptidase [Polyangiaceae bacterium]